MRRFESHSGMAPLRATVEALADRDGLGTGGVDLYEELAPVFDFVAARRQDYDTIAAFVERQAPSDASSVAVGACGGGRLLSRLADDHEDVLGFDRSRAMVDLSVARTDAPVLQADLATFVAPGAFDVFTVMGGTVAHLPPGGPGDPDGVVRLLDNAHESLAPGGVLVYEFMEAGTLESGRVVDQTFESDRFRVERTVVTTGEPRDGDDLGSVGRYTHAYEITDTAADESVRVGTSSLIREFRTGTMLGEALAAGFDDVTLVTPPTHGVAMVARRGE